MTLRPPVLPPLVLLRLRPGLVRTVPLSACIRVALRPVVSTPATLPVALLVGAEVLGLGRVGRLLGAGLRVGPAGRVQDRSEGRTVVGI